MTTHGHDVCLLFCLEKIYTSEKLLRLLVVKYKLKITFHDSHSLKRASGKEMILFDRVSPVFRRE